MSRAHFFNIVLVEPEIPNNTGNIGRTCVGANARLHLIEPLGFELTDKYLKRAGLDYWPHLDLTLHPSFESWLKKVSDPSRIFFFTTKTKRSLAKAEFKMGDWLVFGRETKGLSEDLIRKYDAQTLTIPMYGPIRSYNLANSVSIASYEVLKQFETHGLLAT